jgi:large subunit ribosomal protein L13
MQTYAPKPKDIERRWYLMDADGAVLGRLASEVAKILRGKHKPIFAPHADTGDHVIVINARGVRLTGGKEEKKISFRHSGYPGGLRETVYSRLLARRPAYVVEKAVRGMLPKNRLGRAMIRKLQVYEGAEHPHRAQKPIALKLGEVPAWEGLPGPKPAPAPRPARERRAPAAAEDKPRLTKKATAKRSTAKTTKKSAAKATSKTTTTSRTTRGAKKTTSKSSTRIRSRRTQKEES